MDPKALLKAFAPIAGEAERRAWIVDTLRALGFSPRIDQVGNVIVGEGDLLLAAHYDTVLPPQPLREAEGRLYSPGVGDNSAGVAVLMALAPELRHATLGFTVGEEGLGNLKGARALVAALSPRMMIAVDGYLGTVIAEAVGSVRLAAHFRGPGGHAWGDRGRASTAHAVGVALAALYALPLGENESLNAGRIWGGSAVNAIPAEAGFTLDLRATEASALDRLVERVRATLLEAASQVGVRLEIERLGRRPAGKTATEAMVAAAVESLRSLSVPVSIKAASTDAAAAVEAGIPALAFGVYVGGGAHTEEEWVELDSLDVGLRALANFISRLR